MENLFESQYKITETIYKEMYQYLCFKTPVRICLDVLIGISFIINVFLLVSGDYYTVSAFFLAPFFLGIQFYQYFKAVKLSIKRDAEICSSDDIFIRLFVTDVDIISKTSSGSKTKTPLAKIKKLIQTKTLILLQTEAKLIYIVPKSSFTKGTLDEFFSFLAAKGLK